MFVDEVKLEIYAGDGGDGCTAFHREKNVAMGGPDGGSGGSGSNIVFVVDEGLNTLIDLKYHKIIKGRRGEHGKGSSKHGSSAPDIIIKVPPGTVITDLDTNYIVADLMFHNDRVIVAFGGRGGRGNKAFATTSNPAPNISEYGEEGEYKKLKVELKLLADVGLVGLPSVGKSSIITAISNAKPKIAAYHFTTLSPNLGVVKTKTGKTFVVADLPGLIEGASNGEGLGDQFLRHIERTRVIAHVIDMASVEGRNPYDDYLIINKELESYSKSLISKPQIIIANKMDLEEAKKNLKVFKSKVSNIPVFEVSALLNEGFDEVIKTLEKMLDDIKKEPLYSEENLESHVLYKFESKKPFKILKDGDMWIIKGEQIEKLFKMTKFSSEESIMRFARKLRKMGIDDELDKLGAIKGDIVKILEFEFEYR